jgi:hypothetical protein
MSASVVAQAKKGGGFMAEMEEARREEESNKVEGVTYPLAIQLYPSTKLRAENKAIGVFDEELAKLAEAG